MADVKRDAVERVQIGLIRALNSGALPPDATDEWLLYMYGEHSRKLAEALVGVIRESEESER